MTPRAGPKRLKLEIGAYVKNEPLREKQASAIRRCVDLRPFRARASSVKLRGELVEISSGALAATNA